MKTALRLLRFCADEAAGENKSRVSVITAAQIFFMVFNLHSQLDGSHSEKV
jgi:hypothetical protein